MAVVQNDFVYKRFVQVIDEVFTTMVGLEVQATPIEREERKAIRNEISGMMFLTGEHNAMISLSMTNSSAALVIAYITGITMEELSPSDVCDGMAELVNMIGGRAKAILSGSEYHYQLTSPFTVVGEQVFVTYKNKALQWSAKFCSSEVEMYFEFVYL